MLYIYLILTDTVFLSIHAKIIIFCQNADWLPSINTVFRINLILLKQAVGINSSHVMEILFKTLEISKPLISH